jgi:hypothetical protein
MLSSDESRVHRRTLLQVQERLLTQQSQELLEGSALESLRDSTLSSASTHRASGQAEFLRPQSEPKPCSNSDLMTVFQVPSRTNNFNFGYSTKSRMSLTSERPYFPRDHTIPDAVIVGQLPSLLFQPMSSEVANDSNAHADDAALSGIYSQDKRFPPLLDGNDSSQIAPKGENPVRPKSMNSPRGVTVVPYTLPDSQSNVAVDVVWRRSRSFSELSNAEERTPLKSKPAVSSYDSVSASDSSQVLLQAFLVYFAYFNSCVWLCFVGLTFFNQFTNLDRMPVVRVAIVAILMAAFVGLGYFGTRYLSSINP